MTLRELSYVVALADKQNFGRAAECCHVGQPTLSMQLRKLEDYLEVTLFERNNHHVIPTPIGEEIIEQARIALEAVAEIRDLARQAHDPMEGVVRLGVIPTLGPFLLPPLWSVLKKSFPKLRLVLHEDITARLLDGLRSYRLDALLLSSAAENADIEFLPLFREPLTVALPIGHPLATGDQIHREDLVRYKVVVLEEGHCLRQQVLGIFGGLQSVQAEDVGASSMEMLRQLVAAGVGWTLFPALAAPCGSAAGVTESICFRSLAPPVPVRTLGIAWRRSYSRGATVRGLARCLQANLPAVVERLSANREAA